MVECPCYKEVNVNPEFFDMVNTRRSAREFEPYRVTGAEVEKIVKAAGRAVSSKNTQPWIVRFLQGDSIEKLKKSLCLRFDENAEPSPELDIPLLPEYRRRAVDLGIALFIHKGIGRDDAEARRLHNRANFQLFNAPQAFAVGVKRSAFHEGTLIDLGIFLGYMTLSIEASGFASCLQMSPLSYPDAFREAMPDDSDILFLCVVPFGKPLCGSHVNDFDAGRLPLDAWFKAV